MTDRHKIINDILESRKRRRYDRADLELSNRLHAIEYTYRTIAPQNKELLRYFPIALVACIESYFQIAIKEIIDSGEPYLTNSHQLMPKQKWNFDILKGLHGRTITIGDVIAHYVSISKLEHIVKRMDQLLDIGFRDSLSRVCDRWAVKVRNESGGPIIKDIDESCRYVQRAFELRHIFCHETATKFDVGKEEIDKCLSHSVVFLKASEELVSQTISPDAPLTQMEINIALDKECIRERGLLELALDNAFDVMSESQKTKFIEANEAWKSFVDASVEVEGLKYEGGSLRPMLELRALARLTRERRRQVEDLIPFVRDP